MITMNLNILQRVELLEQPSDSDALEYGVTLIKLTNRIERLEAIIEDMGYYISRK